MSVKQKLYKILDGFENLILKNHACLACRREIPDGTKFSLCKNCLDNLEEIKGKMCEKCGEELQGDNKFCDTCKSVEYNFDKSRSFAKYEEVASKIVKRFKYNGKLYYGEYIAQLMSTKDECFENIDMIVFVPIGDKRKRERGFNQAEVIAENLSKIKNLPFCDCLEKVGNEKHQAGLSKNERQKNLSGTIKLKDEAKKEIKGKNVLIIDDVFTTGATLSECAKILKTAKPKSVFCYTFAKTVLNSTNYS